MTRSRHLANAMAALVAAIFVIATLMPATAQPTKRSGVGPCRQGALSIISLLDGKEDKSADYRHAYDGIVQSCGPKISALRSAPPPPDRQECGKLALLLLDTIENGKLDTPGFALVRTQFADACAPR